MRRRRATLVLAGVLLTLAQHRSHAQSPRCDAPMIEIAGVTRTLSPDGRYLATTLPGKGVHLVISRAAARSGATTMQFCRSSRPTEGA